MNPDRKMRLAAYFNPTGHHVASWRHPRADADAHVNIKHYVEIAQTAERAKFDLIFLADGVATRQADIEAQSRSVQFIANFEPMTLLSALAMVTEKIGLIATMSTSYNEPYNVARKFASLDHISGGRSGWNLVTSGQTAEALNFGRTAPVPHGERYKRAHEFAEIVKGLWDSWDDDAFVRDKDSGLFFEPAKMHYLNHNGQDYSGPRAAQRAAFAAGPSGHGAGGRVRRRPGTRRRIRRGDFQPAFERRGREGLLRRHQEADGEVRPRSRSPQDSSGPERDCCQGRARSAGRLRVPAKSDPSHRRS